MSKNTTTPTDIENVVAEQPLPEGVKVYELAFHFVPTIAEADVPVQFSHLKAIIEKQGGEFIAEEVPRLMKLSYEISQTIKAVKKHYDHGYFGWVKFTLAAENLAVVEKEVKASENILRYLLIKTVKENTLITSREVEEGESADATDAEDGTIKPKSTSKEDGEKDPIINVDQVDDSIEKLVA